MKTYVISNNHAGFELLIALIIAALIASAVGVSINMLLNSKRMHWIVSVFVFLAVLYFMFFLGGYTK